MATNWKPSGFMKDQAVEVTMAVGLQTQTATLAKYGKPAAPAQVDSGIYPMIMNDSFSASFLPPDPFLNSAKMMDLRDSALANSISNVNSDGYPLEVPSGHLYVVLFAETSTATTKTHAGTYKLRWKSSQDLNVSAHLGATVTNQAWDGTDGSADVTFPSGNQGVRFARPDNLAGALDLTDIELVHQKNAHDGTSYQAHLDAGKLWNPDYTQWWEINSKRPGAVRTMVWNSVNKWRTDADSTDVRPLSYSKWYSRTPAAVVAAFANEVNPEYLWVCIPLMADSTYITAYAEILRDTITTETIVIYELSNELWNFGFNQTSRLLMEAVDYFADQGAGPVSTGATVTNGSKTVTLTSGQGAQFTAYAGKPLFIDSADLQSHKMTSVSVDTITLDKVYPGTSGTKTIKGGDWEWRIPMLSKKTEDMRQVLETVYSGTNGWKFNTVQAAQAVGTSDFANYFSTPVWAQVEPTRPPPADRHEWFSISSYFGDSAMSTAIADKYELPDVAGALTDLQTSLINTHVPATLANWATLKSTLGSVAPKTKAIGYEGGSHVVFGGTALATRFVPIWTDYREDATKMTALVDAWTNIEVTHSDGPWCHFQLFGGMSDDGFWGLRYNMDGTTDEWGQKVIDKAGTTAKWY